MTRNVELGRDTAGRVVEVVTGVVVRDVELPFGVGRFALISLDNGLDHTRPNTFGAAGLPALDAALDGMVQNDVEAAVSPACVLATNTSSLLVTEMAARLRRPERVAGFHFFNPVAVLPLLEVVRGLRTDNASRATAFAVARRLGKTAVLIDLLS